MNRRGLAGQQRAFHAAATGPGGLLPGLLRDTPGLDAVAGAGLYAGMYLARLEEALEADFPALSAVLGPDRLHALAHAYAAAHPSDDPDLGRFGRHLPAFLAAHPGERPDLADLARLEWARAEVLVAADAVPAGRESLAALGSGRFPRARLRLVPALRLLELAHDTPAVWRAHERGEPPPPARAAELRVAVWRTGFDVVHGALEPREARALAAAARGASVAVVLAAFDGEGAAAAGFAALTSWLDEGWIAGAEG